MRSVVCIIACISIAAIQGCAPLVDQGKTKVKQDKHTMIFDSLELHTLVKTADSLLLLVPQTITSFEADRSEGGIHDYYSEGAYWWPDPQCATCPYIRKDGQRNPANFRAHKLATREFTFAVTTLTAAYRRTANEAYAQKAIDHLRAWFVAEHSKMNPSLLYSQAIKGISSGRGIGIIDSIVFINIALSVEYLLADGILSGHTAEGVKQWFDDFSTWLTTHPYGIEEQHNDNNHSTWWGAQVAAYARVAGRSDLIALSQAQYKRQLDIQMAADGSFPDELRRTKPFHYMNYNLRAWACFAHVASTNTVNLWQYKSKNGSIARALDFAVPYYRSPSKWPYATVLEPKIHPKNNDFLLFSYWGLADSSYYTLWTDLKKDTDVYTSAHLIMYQNIFGYE